MNNIISTVKSYFTQEEIEKDFFTTVNFVQQAKEDAYPSLYSRQKNKLISVYLAQAFISIAILFLGIYGHLGMKNDEVFTAENPIDHSNETGYPLKIYFFILNLFLIKFCPAMWILGDIISLKDAI